MAISDFIRGKQLRFVDMFFTFEEEDIMKVCILQNIPVRGDSVDCIQEKCVRLIEDEYESYEWIIDFNRNMNIYMNGVYYRDLSSFHINSMKVIKEDVATYSFDLLVTDMPVEYSRVEIVTGVSVLTDSYNEAIAKVRAWIERKYSHFKELEWYINSRGKMQICFLSFKSLFND